MSDFRTELLNTVQVRAEVEHDLSASAFMNEIAERMAVAEEIEDLKAIHFRGLVGRRNAGVDGYDIGDTDDSVAVAIAHYDGSPEGGTLNRTDVSKLYAQLETYLTDAMAGTFHIDREHADPAVQLAQDLRSRGRSITRFRLYLFTDLALGARFTEVRSGEIGGVPVDYHVWDIRRLELLANASEGRSELDLDLTEWVPGGVPALSLKGDGNFETYLAALPGALLADLYGRHGSRLLESNVRSFLSGRGNINKGIRTTILSEAQMFLAYNNGITATATAVERGPDGALLRLSNLQIVNGGQTTASLFYVRRDSSPKPDLSDVFVQMKLVVVDPETAADLVPKISRFANSQNRVSEADFFSNSPFHVRMEELSRRVLVPAHGGGHFQTKWFYERTRGQYQNEKAKLSAAEAKKFDAVNPKSQLMTKTDAAKYSVSWDQEPHKVSAGAQKNFVAFANSVAGKWATSDAQFNETYYKELVAKAILFNAIRARVAKADWYQSGYLANIVAYTMAKLSHAIATQAKGSRLDFGAIWNRQAVSSAVLEASVEIAHLCFTVLTSEARPIQNVTEWAKREQCWTTVKQARYQLPTAVANELVSAQVVHESHRDAKFVQKIDNGIAAQARVFEVTTDEWMRIKDFASANRLLSPSDSGILALMTGTLTKVPSELQSKRLLQIRQRAQDHGFR